jgi:hypothetical protein
MYSYFGSLARASTEVHERTRGEWFLYLFGLMATVAVTVVVTRIARNALARRGEADAAPAV